MGTDSYLHFNEAFRTVDVGIHAFSCKLQADWIMIQPVRTGVVILSPPC
jgi:hypothetical protein